MIRVASCSQIEMLDIVPSWGHLYLPLNLPAIDPLAESVPNTEFFRRLSRHMGFADAYLYETDEQLIETALTTSDPLLTGITLERLKKESWLPVNLPEDWRPFANGNFPTPSGKAEFYSPTLEGNGIDPLPSHTMRPKKDNGRESHPLVLITGKSLHFLNSSYANSERCSVSERARPGVVSLPFGWWASASSDGRSANTLATDRLSDWGGTGALYDTFVEVEKVVKA
jgi:anaerobic selenocysteine-containing dehydrogenase